MGSQSPEGQCFLILAYSAYNQWDAMGRPGEDSSDKNPLGKTSGAERLLGWNIYGLGTMLAVIFCIIAQVCAQISWVFVLFIDIGKPCLR